ncbi:ATP:dephospho-CoA triphosphoribosyl transferase [Rosistilla carotiformis]|uniref:ATP:dephospho-CoA triphosphoribosyl transferase n=1 Tax=Rosistilla carotiformis TaxID=2528017 RepID=A0A518JVD1_9BACT|nr:triphosphoribosyl-dephospho-CoA synthase [Rosistilla carotiformis]QDV69495.1 ATP:dephospho-CoA triphosphoribosyl transferase [Rosistilla carotiformis]
MQCACTLEATAPKAGNVYPGQEFDDLGVTDFLAAASVCGTTLDRAAEHSIGELILQCVQQSRAVTRSNANLGIVLLMAPLAKAAAAIEPVRDATALRCQLQQQLEALTPEDGRLVFEAIRIAAAGGLGDANSQDVRTTQKNVDLMEAMRTGQDRDKIAEQYSTGFQFLFETVVPCLRNAIEDEGDRLRGITRGQIELLAGHVDTLIQRKCGAATAKEAMRRARTVNEAHGWRAESPDWIEFNQWLRSDGNRRNPGTTADLIAAGLFVLIYSGISK